MKNNGTTVPKITQNLWSIFRNDMSVQMCTHDFNLLKPRGSRCLLTGSQLFNNYLVPRPSPSESLQVGPGISIF